MKNIAVITARGGSKRIPHKNLKIFCGKPILSYSIAAALNAGIFDEVMVSTDDMEIAEIAKNAGAAIPFMRSQKTSDDYATTRDVLLEVLQEYKAVGREFDNLCCIYPTAPFVTAKKLQNAMKMLQQKNADCVSPVVRYSFPPQRCYVIQEGILQHKWPEYRLNRSQDLEPYYHDCGQFYAYKIDSFLRKERVDWIHVPVIMPETEVQDIDNEEDWKIAELKYQAMQNVRDEYNHE